jgi:protein PsiE
VFLIFQVFYFTLRDFFVDDLGFHGALEQIFLILLLVEVVAAIKLYFVNNHHFPLRFIFYIGITDLIRRLIISWDTAGEVMEYSLGILILVVVLSIWELKSFFLEKWRSECTQCPPKQEKFEL